MNKEEVYLEDGSAKKIVKLIKEINDPEQTKNIIDDENTRKI